MCTSASIFLAVLLCMLSGTTCNQPFTADMIAGAVVSGSNMEFGLHLYQKLSNQEGNLVFSPLSAQTVLTMLWLGAGGSTARQLEQGVRILPESQLHVVLGFKNLFQDLQSTAKVTIEQANKLYLQEGCQINSTFQQALTEGFQSPVQEVDFVNDTEVARASINQWVDEKTHGKIKDLIAEGSLSSYAKIVAVNALYFKGSWLKPFPEDRTTIKSFHVSSTSTINVPMMNEMSHYWYASNQQVGFKAIRLLYRVRDAEESVGQPEREQSISMVILLPDEVEGLSQVENFVTAGNLRQVLRDMTYRSVNITLPKFKIEQTIPLVDKLKQLGITQLFQEGADLSGISDGNLYVSQVLQKAVVEVTEKGTEAAASTYLELIPMSAIIPAVFNANHPFLFTIIEENHDVILFMGRIVQPS